MDSIVETSHGKVRGRQTGLIAAFKGIPYGAAPLGRQRWRESRPTERWSGVRDALEFGPDACQPQGILFFDHQDRQQSEDCLFLNVWAPQGPGGPRPVMVFIHGGGYETGGAARQLYDGHALAQQGDVIVVTLNYRLGVLGLLAHPDLGEAGGPVANWAMLDQLAALRWVHENVAAFGGDPNQVTIFGESAGAVAVCLLCVAPAARGLFRRAIAQSGSPLPVSYEQALRATDALLGALQISDPSKLRELPVEKLLGVQPAWKEVGAAGRMALRPCLGGSLLPLGPMEAASAGDTSSIELVIGTNRDELNFLAHVEPALRELTEDALVVRIEALLADDASKFIESYRLARAERGERIEPWALYAAIMADGMIRVPGLKFLERHSAAGGSGYAYHVTWESPTEVLGACHGIELPFCFRNLNSAPHMRAFAGLGPDADRFMERVSQAWIAFAHGDAKAAFGSPYSAESRATMQFGRDSGPVTAPSEAERVLWAERIE